MLKNGIVNSTVNIAQMFEQLSDKQMVDFFNTHFPSVNGTINKRQKQILEQVLSRKYRSTELNLI